MKLNSLVCYICLCIRPVGEMTNFV